MDKQNRWIDRLMYYDGFSDVQNLHICILQTSIQRSYIHIRPNELYLCENQHILFIFVFAYLLFYNLYVSIQNPKLQPGDYHDLVKVLKKFIAKENNQYLACCSSGKKYLISIRKIVYMLLFMSDKKYLTSIRKIVNIMLLLCSKNI